MLEVVSRSGDAGIGIELGRSLKDPINLSIGQPHFDVPEAIKAASATPVNTRCSMFHPPSSSMNPRKVRSKIHATQSRPL